MDLSIKDVELIARATAEKVLQDLRHYALQYKDPFTIVDGLMDSMSEENRATVWYRSRAADARQKYDPTTAELYEHIAQEEDQHHQEFKERLGILLGISTSLTFPQAKAVAHHSSELTEREARYGFLQLNETEYQEALKSGRYPEPTRYGQLTAYYAEPHEANWKGLSLAEMFPTKYKDLLQRGVPHNLSPLEVQQVIEEKRIPYDRGINESTRRGILNPTKN